MPGNLTFEGINFWYTSRQDVLAANDISLSISRGQHIALAESGAGKTTIFQLLLRFYSPESGRILLDGIDISDADPKAVRQLIGIVPQDTVIFGSSAKENIRFGRPSASDEEVRAAAVAASAHEFIDRLPEGYDTYLGEKGTRLSGGQKQRIAIARAILKDPPVLLLDEATSALDAENERQVQAALEQLQQGRTTLVIAHRLSTIQEADRIVVLEEGRILDVGSHQELLMREPAYKKMVDLQFGSEKFQAAEEIAV